MKLRFIPMPSASVRMNWQPNEWNVLTTTPRPRPPVKESTRWRISAAALLVKVTARMFQGFTPSDNRWAMRQVITRVFPEPAPAKIRSGPSPWVTAWRWGGFRASRMSGERAMGRSILDLIRANGLTVRPPDA